MERSPQTGHALREVEEILRRHELVFDRDVMAPATIEPCNVPGVLDLPLVGRQQKASNQRRPFFAGRPRRILYPYSPLPMFRCALQIHSAAHCNTKFSTGREPAIRLRANCSLEHRSTAVELLRGCAKSVLNQGC